MKTDIYDRIFSLNQAANLDEMAALFERHLQHYGFDQFAVQYVPYENIGKGNQPYALATFDQGWVNYYKTEGFHTIDPVVVSGTKKKTPFLWSSLWKGVDMSKRQNQFFNEAADCGVSAGVGLPIPLTDNEPGMVSFISTCCDQKEVAKILNKDHLELMLLSTTFQHGVIKMNEKKESPFAPRLSRREKECLHWAAVGKSDIEIGGILNISYRTVNAHMYSSYRKLDCVSREQAVLKAAWYRIITP